jgi:hypothetical protein
MNAGDDSHGSRRILLDGAGTRREAVLQALLQLGAGPDADAIADALDSYVRRLVRRTGVRWRVVWLDSHLRARLIAGPQATVHFRAKRGRWEQKRLASGTRALIARRGAADRRGKEGRS